jgi:hypothetical protein
MSAKLETLVLERQQVAYRPPATYADNVGLPLFNIIGGPVWIKGFFMHSVLGTALATTLNVTCNGLAWDNGALAYTMAADTFWVWPLRTGIAQINALVTPMPTTLGLANNIGVVASANAADNTITIVIAGGFGGIDNPASFYCVYYPMTHNSQIIPA